MSMNTTTNTKEITIIEMAYRKHGESWKRKTFRTEAELDRWFDKHGDDVAEVRYAND